MFSGGCGSKRMNQYPSTPTPLPVIQIIGGAFQFVWDKRIRFLCALAIPIVLLFILKYVITLANDDPWKFVQAFFNLAICILFAITCHRLVLLGDEGIPNFGLKAWTLREWRYMGWAIVILAIWMLFSFVINSFIVSAFVKNVEAGGQAEAFESVKSLSYVVYIPLLYIFSRLSVLYPAIALDRQVTAQWAWRITDGNGWRMTVVVSFLPWALYYLTSLLLREYATLAENIILDLLGFALLAVQDVALSFSYKHLAEIES
jgi:hypothetical protein